MEGHVASLELSQARPTLLPSVGSAQKSLPKRRNALARLVHRTEAVAGRLSALDVLTTALGVLILDIRDACHQLQLTGIINGNPLQTYQSIDASTKALQAALAVIEHSYPGFEKSRQQLLWPSLPVQDHVSASLQLVALATSLNTRRTR